LSRCLHFFAAPEDIAEIVLGVLNTPERVLISRVEVRPAKPRKYPDGPEIFRNRPPRRAHLQLGKFVLTRFGIYPVPGLRS
jgi:hypothetical protein